MNECTALVPVVAVFAILGCVPRMWSTLSALTLGIVVSLGAIGYAIHRAPVPWLPWAYPVAALAAFLTANALAFHASGQQRGAA